MMLLTRSVVPLALAHFAFAACGFGDEEESVASEGAEDMTIVVEADQSRLLQEEQQLAEQEETVRKERKRLKMQQADVDQKLSSLSKMDRKQREKLEMEKSRLESQYAKLRNREDAFDKERVALEQEKSRLLDRIARMTKQKGGLTIAQREEFIAKRERSVAAREAAVAQREKELGVREKQIAELQAQVNQILQDTLTKLQAGGPTRTVVVSSGGGASASRGTVIRLNKKLNSRMRTKGVLVDDLPPHGKELHQASRKAMAEKDFASAHEALAALEVIVNGISVDGAFVGAKAKRVNEAYEGHKLDEAREKRKRELLTAMTDSFSGGRFDRANKILNQIVSLYKK